MRTLNLVDNKWLLRGLGDGQGDPARLVPPQSAHADEWKPAEVPGAVQTELIRRGEKPDPFMGTNTKVFADLEDTEWWYRTAFDVPHTMRGDRVELVFDCLDTLADIWLNEEHVASHANMFVPLRIDVSRRLKNGEENRLVVRLASVTRYGKPLADEAADVRGPGFSERSFVRKSQFQFGWDWAARLVPTGIPGSVRIESFRAWRLTDVRVRTYVLSAERARLSVAVTHEPLTDDSEDVRMKLVVRNPNGRVIAEEHKELGPEDAKSRVWNADVEVADPQLWWPNGYGDQPLYTVETAIESGDALLDAKTVRTGIRTLTIEQPPDPDLPKTQFYVQVNGAPIFSKGSNWVPADYFVHETTPDRCKRFLELARDGHFTMLRVWGGGIYESDLFYDLCDEYGILVFQDFMFACGSYPDYDEAFCESVRTEAEYQVKRLRNHPCLALWAGCNENAHMARGGRLYHEILRGACGKHDPDRFYMATSPGVSDHADSWKAGDRHAHRTFMGADPGPRDEGSGCFYGYITEDWLWFLPLYDLHVPERTPVFEDVHWTCMRHEKGSFMSETLAFPGVPDKRTIQACIPKGQRCTRSEAWLHHVPYAFPTSQNQIDLFMRELFGVEPPKTEEGMDDYLRRLELIQPEAWRYCVELLRTRFTSCAGLLSWMYNTPWPNMDFSVVDCFGRPNAGYFGAKRGCAPLMVTLREASQHLDRWGVWVCNDTLQRPTVRAEYGLVAFTGKTLWRDESKATVAPCSSHRLADFDCATLPAFDPTKACLYARLWLDDRLAGANRAFLKYYKDLEFPEAAISAEWQPNEAGARRLRIATDRFAWAVKLTCLDAELDFSDNVFDLLPGDSHDVEVMPRVVNESDISITVSAINSKPVAIPLDA